MAQTTAGIPVSGFKVEVSTNGSVWTDISGSAATVTVEGGDNKVGTQFTADGEEAIVVGANKVEPRTVTVRSIYTETSGEAFDKVWTQYDGAEKSIYLRWSPRGGSAGDFQYSCAVGGAAAAVPIVSCTLPEQDAGAEDVALFEFSVMTPGLLKSTVST